MLLYSRANALYSSVIYKTIPVELSEFLPKFLVANPWFLNINDLQTR